MWAWRKKDGDGQGRRSLALAALENAPPEELIREAVLVLPEDGRSDRIGVWLDLSPQLTAAHEEATSFRGCVWEAGGGDVTPCDWERLSLEAPLPPELLEGQSSLEEMPENSTERPMIGAHSVGASWHAGRGKGAREPRAGFWRCAPARIE